MKAILFDTETTGLSTTRLSKLDAQPYIIEFYACLVDLKKDKLLAECDILIKPPIKVSDEITKITGITNDMIVDKQPFSYHADEIEKFFKKERTAIAHNASFDQEVVNIEFDRLGRKLAWGRLICSVESTVHYKGFNLSLSNLHDYLFKEKFEGAHRAKVDVVALKRCCVELFKRGDL